jgi:short-subunit dehydrogenase
MVHAFLPGMIERKRGKIVSICSMTGICTIPSAVVYSATKYGVKGFMSALYDELCVNDTEKFIHLTTVYPDFINTRKDMVDVLEKVKHMILLLTPAQVADRTIEGVLSKKRNVYISDYFLAHFAAQ